MATILTEAGATDVAGAEAVGDHLWLPIKDLTRATGWTMKPEGLCHGEVCVPVPHEMSFKSTCWRLLNTLTRVFGLMSHDRNDQFVREGAVNVAEFWRHTDSPVLHDAAGDTWMLGNSAGERARALETLEAPDFTLPDLDGKPHSLSDYRGKRVFLTTWSSW